MVSVPAHVYQNILVTRIQVVVLNVCQILIATVTRHVRITDAKIHAQEHAELMQNVEPLIIRLHVLALLDTLVIHKYDAMLKVSL